MPVSAAGTLYATLTDLQNEGLPSLAQQTLSDPQKNAALANASAMVDSYISTRFELPLNTWGLDIVRATVAIASWDLMNRRGRQPGEDNPGEPGYKAAIAWLKDVSAGKATPAFPTTVDTNGFNPQTRPMSLQPVAGGIGLSTSNDTTITNVGTLRTPLNRGW
jgi:phage gp36-like protein